MQDLQIRSLMFSTAGPFILALMMHNESMSRVKRIQKRPSESKDPISTSHSLLHVWDIELSESPLANESPAVQLQLVCRHRPCHGTTCRMITGFKIARGYSESSLIRNKKVFLGNIPLELPTTSEPQLWDGLAFWMSPV